MRFHAALVLAALAAACHCAQGNSPVIGLSGDNTRHGVVVLHGDFKATQEVVVTRYHVDTLIQTRFARSVIEVEVQNNADAARQIVIPFAIPATAMLTSFEIESDGEKHQARAVLKDSIQVDSTSTSATIKARNAEAFDVDVELASGGSALLRIEYEELLTRHLQRYKTVQQVWPGSVIADLRLSVRIKEATAIVDDVAHSLTTEDANNNIVTVNATRTVKVSKVQQAQGLAEVTITLQPSVSEQRELARQLGLDPERGLAGQLNVDYDVERYPTAGDIVVRNGHFAHFFAPSDLNSTSALPKYALFLLDTSGSMGGTKIQQLRDAMKTIIAQLAPQDYFTIINFSDSNNMWQLSTPSAGKYCNIYPATAQNVAEAQALASQMIADSGTALLGGLQQSLTCASDGPAGLEPILLVLTDGIPNEPIRTILTDTQTRNRPNGDDNVLASIFTIALGADANLDFLRQLALQNEGKFQQVYATQDASLQLQDFYSSIATPLLTNVSVVFDYATADQLSLTETDFRTYFWGSELVVAGRLLPGAGDRLTGEITANGAGGVVVRYPIQVTALPNWNPEKVGGVHNSKRLWAWLRTSQLLDQALVDGAQSTAAGQATDLALEHSYVTTSTCLAVDVVNPYVAPTPADDPDDTDAPETTLGPNDATTPPPAPLPTGAPAPPPTAGPGPVPPTGAPAPPPTAGPGPVPPTGAPAPPPTAGPGPVPPTGAPAPPPTAGPGPVPPTGAPLPPPTGAPVPPAPRPSGAPSGGSQNSISIGSVSVGTLNVNGPLIQFNLRRR